MDIPILWIAIILGIAGLLAGFGWWGSTRKKGKIVRNIGMFLGFVGIAAFLLAWGGFIPQTYTTQATQAPLTSAPTPNQVGTVCAVEDTSVTLSGQDAYLATATGGNHRYRINGNIATVGADPISITASPGNVIEVMWMNGSGVSYFSKVMTYTVPCQGTYPITEKLSKNGTLTTRIYNTDNVLESSSGVAAANQSLGAGDVKTLKMELEEAYQKEVPYGSVMVVEYNTTTIDDVIVQSNGVELPIASVLQAHTPVYGTTSARKAYMIPGLVSNKINSFTIVIDTDDTTAPSGPGDNIPLTFYHKNYFTNDKNGGAFEGPSAIDEYEAVTRTGYESTTIYVN